MESTELRQGRERDTQVSSWEVVEAEMEVDGDGEPGGEEEGKDVSTWCF